MQQPLHTDVLIIGAGASGLYCAKVSGNQGRSVTIIDHTNKAGKKILMSGGGRCNFTNYYVESEQFIGNNAHFCKSALSRYSSWDFISLVEKHGIAYHEKEYGQLFCDDSAKDILNMLINECAQAGVNVRLNTQTMAIKQIDDAYRANNPNLSPHLSSNAKFLVTVAPTQLKVRGQNKEQNTLQSDTQQKPQTQIITCESLVIATGGLSIPTLGASGFGYEVAQQFGHEIIPTEASLVPFTFTDKLGATLASLAGLSIDVVAFNERISFALPMLFTHRGLSGPAMLQLSNYWYVGEPIHINLLPTVGVTDLLLQTKTSHPKQRIRTVLAEHLPKKLLAVMQTLLWEDIKDEPLANMKDERLKEIGDSLNNWTLKPSGTEGYRTAEVTRGGINTDEVSSKTFESKLCPNLYFIGEVLDVTGWLGGYNFQWAWASADACGKVV